MKIKKGFTLSEVLIALTLIGVVSAMAVPSLLGNANTQKKSAALKKGFGTVSNACAQMLAKNALPTSVATLATNIAKEMNVKTYYNGTTKAANVNSGANWIMTDDGVAFKVEAYSTANTCSKDKVAINNGTTDACWKITIDINGPVKGENTAASVTLDGTKVKSISGDRFVVYYSDTGIAPGNSSTAAGAKNPSAAAQILDAED